jgi:hypothetical protein
MSAIHKEQNQGNQNANAGLNASITNSYFFYA